MSPDVDPRVALLEKELELAKVQLPLPGWADNDAVRPLVMEELVFSLIPETHERWIPSYGTLIIPRRGSFERIPVSPLGLARSMADGQASFTLYEKHRFRGVALFANPLRTELEIVQQIRALAAIAICRAPDGTVTLYSPQGVVRHRLRVWSTIQNVNTAVDRVVRCAPMVSRPILQNIMEFALHGLSPAGIGATLVWMLSDAPVVAGQQTSDPNPIGLTVDSSVHTPALIQLLRQIDGATVFSPDGHLLMTGVHLIPSDRAESLIRPTAGTRHTSARRFSFDRSDTIVVVVSEDGPVSVFSDGARLAHMEPYSATGEAALLRDLVPTKAEDVFDENFEARCKQCGKYSSIEVVTVIGWKDRESANCPVCGKEIAARMCFHIEAVPMKRMKG
jgi:DNA integrity scanning protein DisA with diadenylate cyclase activity